MLPMKYISWLLISGSTWSSPRTWKTSLFCRILVSERVMIITPHICITRFYCFSSIFRFGKLRSSSWETCMQVKKQQLEPDTEQQTGSKLGRVSVKTVYCHSVHLTYMQSTLCKSHARRSTSWNQDCQKKYQ